MKIEILRKVLPVVVGVIVPLFFLLVYLGSCLSRLASLRRSCRIQLAALCEALRSRYGLAMKAAECLREQGHTGRELTALEMPASALNVLRGAPGSQSLSDEAIRSLGAAAHEIEQACAGVLASRGEPSSRPADPALQRLLPELDASQVALGAATVAYNQAVQLYAQARNRFPVRLLAGICGFRRLPSIPIDPGPGAARPSSTVT